MWSALAGVIIVVLYFGLFAMVGLGRGFAP
jgi:hypothetical protein